MGTESTRVALAAVLAAFDGADRPGAPLTAPEVAESVGCARRTAYEKLTQLTDQGELETKKVGARGRVWWRPQGRAETPTEGDQNENHDDVSGTAHEQALRELHDASRRLIRAETRETVSEIAVDAARRILGLSMNGLWLHDPGTEELTPVAWTEEGVEQFGEPEVFPVDGSLAGDVFRDGSYRVYDDITTEEDVYDPETRVRAELILPLADHGVLIASSLSVGDFDEVDVSLGRILAANVETALDRADHLAERRERRRELERQRDELERLNRLNTLVEDIIASLVDAATRREIERTVCERLAESPFYVDAWTVERGSEPGELVVRAGAEDAPTFDAGTTDHPVETAMTTNAPQVIPSVTTDERVPEPLRAIARETDAQSCLVAPLSYADTVFGALVVHAPAVDGFSDRERAAFETLGRVVGFLINATNNRQLLLGNTAVELEVVLSTADAWFVTAARHLDGSVTVEGLVPTDGEVLIEYVTVEDATGDVPEILAAVPGVVDARVLATEGDRWSVECTVREEGAALGAVTEFGATIRTARATGETGTVTARFPATASPRDAMAVVREALPSAELGAKRVVDVSDRSVTSIRQTVTERLTDKQLAALRAAALSGYYESPRQTTAQDLAASLSIASSTLHQHLQAAQRKVLATVFEEVPAN